MFQKERLAELPGLLRLVEEPTLVASLPCKMPEADTDWDIGCGFLLIMRLGVKVHLVTLATYIPSPLPRIVSVRENL